MPKLAKLTKWFKAWSFSRLQDYRKCPFFAACKHLRGMKEPGNKAMARGSVIDQIAKDFALKQVDDSKLFVPDLDKPKVKVDPLKLFRKEFNAVRKLKGVEADPDWSFTASWTPTKWNDWDNCWLRVKVDLVWQEIKKKVVRLVVIDNKTGKINPAHDEQLHLYATSGLIVKPNVDEVGTQLWYLDHGVAVPSAPKVYPREQLPEMKAYWIKETKPMLADRRFATKPGPYCSYCHFRKDNGGPCVM